ncbi:MAG TPA: oligosaccharide flippase family protein [Thermoleophilaceae bacterium]
MTDPLATEVERDVLDTGRAGGMAIRGGALRLLAYGAALLLSLISVPFMTRHLGVVDYGHYVTVASVVFIIGGITEAGLTNLGVREFAVLSGMQREEFLRNLTGLRFALTAAGVVAATAFMAVTGAETVVVQGTFITGFALLLTLTQQTYAIPLSARLRLGVVSGLELLKQAVLTGTILILVAAGATLLPFFAASAVAGVAVLAATLLVVRHDIPLRPAIELVTWRRILRDVLPYAVATAVGLIYFRLAVIVMSYVASDYQTGIYSTAFRVVEAVGVIPWLVVSAGFPIMARAARDDESRLRYALQKLFDVSTIVGVLIALAIGLGASFAIDVIAGLPEFEDSVPVLRVLGIAMVTSFLVATWSFALLSLRAHRELLLSNAAAAVAALVGTLVLAPTFDAMGAAVATLGAEAVLAMCYLVALTRRERSLTPSFGVIPKVGAAAAVGACAAFIPAHAVVQTVAGVSAAVIVLFLLRAVPHELINAIRRRDP